MKACTKCKEVKPFTAFSKDKTKKHQLQSWCKVCRSKYMKEYRTPNEAMKEHNRTYMREYMRQYRRKHNGYTEP